METMSASNVCEWSTIVTQLCPERNMVSWQGSKNISKSNNNNNKIEN